MLSGDKLENPKPITGHLEAATIEDVSNIKQIMQQALDFKCSKGDGIWGSEPFTEVEVTRMIESGTMFVYRFNGAIAASVLLSTNDKRMWGEENPDEPAIYIHKLCVGDIFRHQGVGSSVMSMVESFAQKNNITKMRLDCSYDNADLCKYYQGLGFKEIKKCYVPSSVNSKNPNQEGYRAALFEKTVEDLG